LPSLRFGAAPEADMVLFGYWYRCHGQDVFASKSNKGLNGCANMISAITACA
jgi:hypothetical protein